MRVKLDFPIYINEIIQSANGTPIKVKNTSFPFVTTDSREAINGDLFFALPGKKHNGEKYVTELLKKGVTPISTQSYSGCIKVDNTKNALLALASAYKNNFKSLKHTVAITGSVGKTTTKNFAHVILSQKYKTHSTYNNYNNDIGVPITLFSMPRDTEALIVEMGMNHQGEISRLSRCALPDIAVILNVGTAHIGNLGTRERIAEAKLEITKGMQNGVTVVPKNEPLLNLKADQTFSIDDKDATYCCERSDNGTVSFYYKKTLVLSAKFQINEKHFVNCLAASLGIASLAGLSAEEIRRGISRISYKNTRQNIINCKNIIFFADYYNASYESIKADLDALFDMDTYCTKSVLLGDILELGKETEAIHRAVGKLLAGYKLNNIYLFGEYSDYVSSSAIEFGISQNRIHVNKDLDAPEITVEQIKEFHTFGEIILLKGSRGVRLERILDSFKKQ